MEIEQKFKITNILKILIFTLILLILTLGMTTRVSATKLYYEDIANLYRGIPRDLLSRTPVYCSGKGKGTTKFMDLSLKFVEGLQDSSSSYFGFGAKRTPYKYSMMDTDAPTGVQYDWSYFTGRMKIAKQYKWIYITTSSKTGFRGAVDIFINNLRGAAADKVSTSKDYRYYEDDKETYYGMHDGGSSKTYTHNLSDYSNPNTYYKTVGLLAGLDYSSTSKSGLFDYDRVINNSIGLPGLKDSKKPPLYYLEFTDGEEIAADQVQAALYISSSSNDWDTKQYALWGLPKDGYIYNQGLVTGGNWLTNVAELYENMYKKLSELKAQGMTMGEAYLASIKTTGEKDGKISIGGGTYDKYVYHDTVWEVDKNEKAYYLGPFVIDYSVIGGSSTSTGKSSSGGVWKDTDVPGTYYDGGWMGWIGVYFNYIKNVTIYNQDKKDISELGGSFEILDEDRNVIYDGNKEDLQKIGPGQKFYIKINMGSMEAKDFENFYAKFDFCYLNNVGVEGSTGGAKRYKAIIHRNYYKITDSQKKDFHFTGYYNYEQHEFQYTSTWWTNSEDSTDVKWTEPTGEDAGKYTKQTYDHYEWIKHTGSYAEDLPVTGLEYTLIDEPYYDDEAQPQTYLYGEREWDGDQSIVITSEWEPIDVEIDIKKTCSEHPDELLHGATFDITLDIAGTDRFANPINKQLTFTRTTGTDGIARLPKNEIEAMGVDLSSFNGKINVTAKETNAPADHKITKEIYTGTWTSGTLTINATDEHDKPDERIIKLAKVNDKGEYIDADFEVAVTLEGQDYPSIADNTIKGSTEDGVMYITYNDLKSKGIELDEDFTGTILLEIMEVKTQRGYTIRGQGKTVTLKYENGELKEYNQTDDELMVEYLFEDALENFLNGGDFKSLPTDIQKYINDQINKQLQNKEQWIKDHPDLELDQDLSYADIMEIYRQYIKEHKEDFFKTMTESSVRQEDGIVQIVIKNDEGDPKLPDIPWDGKPTPPPGPYDLTMTVAGYAFLDGTESKGKVYNSDKMLNAGDKLLSGIKVTLVDSNGAIAQLVPNSEDPSEIRTNPTMTNDNGFYEFRGVDPTKDYRVVFEYNGISYQANPADVKTYNTDDWAKSAKASENENDANTLRSKYNLITPTTSVYTYEELSGIYDAITACTLNYINSNNRYPDENTIREEVKKYVNADQLDDIDARLNYIFKDSVITATAGYGKDNSGTYPHETRKEFLMNHEFTNLNRETYEFMKEQVNRLYPGQLQIHLGLVRRDKTNLSLLKDVVESKFTINGHSTTYKYETGDANYTEYVYEEDYRYDEKDEENSAKAYYDPNNENAITTEQAPKLNITYKITVTNETVTPTSPVEIVDYYDSNFNVVGAWIGEKAEDGTWKKVQEIEFSDNGYQQKGNVRNENGKDYSAVYLKVPSGVVLSVDQRKAVDIILELESKDAKQYLNDYIRTEDNAQTIEGKILSKAKEIENFAEINAYSTNGSYIDANSHPGTFNIGEYKTALQEYQKASSDLFDHLRDSDDVFEQYNILAQKAEAKLQEVSEDDNWEVSLTLINNGFKRELEGSVWEAISEDVKTASDLQNRDELLTYIENNGIKGITVELVELRDFEFDSGESKESGNTVVRATTSTDEKGNYKFESYIPGNYVVRFIYGDKTGDDVIKSEFSKDSEEKPLQINGQYYQSTKAYNNTDANEYWYDDDKKNTRYSDAQDSAQSRVKQIDAEMTEAEGGKPSKTNTEENTMPNSHDYNYTGAIAVDSGAHQDKINAYTSSIHVEVEYTKQTIDNASGMVNNDYNYKIKNVDFGLTPRAGVDLEIDKYVSNIKVYLQDGRKQLDCNFKYDEEKKQITDVELLTDGVSEEFKNLIIPHSDSQTYLDGMIEVLMDDELYNGAQLEVTYTISVDNKSEFDTLRWIINGDDKVGVVYYQDEDYTKLPFYEQGNVIYQDDEGQKFNKISKSSVSETADEDAIVRTKANTIVDFVEPNLQFATTDYLGNAINEDWEHISTDEFISSREDDTELMAKYNEFIKAKDTDGDEHKSKLLDALEPRKDADEENENSFRSTTLTLVTTLGTTASDTNDYEYHNLIEITQMGNTSGRVKKIEYYDVEGKTKTVTSSDTYKEDERKTFKAIPTIGTSKSETVVIHAPTGLPISDRVQTNLIIVFTALVVLAGGIVLIKRFVLKPKAE